MGDYFIRTKLFCILENIDVIIVTEDVDVMSRPSRGCLDTKCKGKLLKYLPNYSKIECFPIILLVLARSMVSLFLIQHCITGCALFIPVYCL